MNPYDFAGKTVLVTGASMGIGAAFARDLSRRGAKLVLVARSEDKLATLARELGGAEVIAADLAQPGAARRLFDAVSSRGLTVDVLVNNAGYGLHGRFDELELTEQAGEISLNVVALVELTHAFLPMLERQRGGVLQVGSTVGFLPVPYMAIYGATKAFVLSFTEALWAEYRHRGVRVTHLAPGATETPFFERSGGGAAVGARARPEDVVRAGLEAFIAGRPNVVPGFKNWFLTFVGRFLPRALSVKLTERVMRPPALPLPQRRETLATRS